MASILFLCLLIWSVDVLLWIRTRGHRMVGVDESTDWHIFAPLGIETRGHRLVDSDGPIIKLRHHYYKTC